jgi:predicted DNA-binding protein (MmcQ/YjbR family)
MILISIYRGTKSGWFGVSVKNSEKDANRLIFYANRIHPDWHLKKESI